MKAKITHLISLAALGLLTACGDGNVDNNTQTAQTEAEAPQKAIKLVDFEASPDFPDARLAIKDIKTEMVNKDSVKITIHYAVDNYELKKQTSAPAAGACNNSKDGQHIHFILDNAPYVALYQPEHSFVVPVNTSHYVMSFLSRSFHESLKNPEAGVLLKFSVDSKGVLKQEELPNTPMLFYSRPKGDYVGDDTKNVLLDYYLYNASLAASGTKVRATINGNEFMLDEWKPQFIQNAPMGAMKVKLELIDQDGNVLSGDNTSIEREVQLAGSEPVR